MVGLGVASFLTEIGTWLGHLLSPQPLGLMALGVFLGILVGAIPGLTATLAIALLLPFTFRMPPVDALIFLVSIYAGGLYGGAITAITIRIPGAPSNVMTALDGFQMAQRGRAEAALGLATFSSFVGGVFGGAALVLVAPQIAQLALRFQSPETLALVVLALVAVAGVESASLLRGLTSAALGLMLATVGLDPMIGAPRYWLGVSELMAGIPLQTLVIGLFAIAELLRRSAEPERKPPLRPQLRLRRMFDFWPLLRGLGARLPLKSAIIGTVIGALPGAGASMAAFLSYSEAKRSSRRPERFGTGIPEGIVAAETANNAVTGGALIPMLSLGIPGDAVTAVILSALLIQGIFPGPRLFQRSGELIAPLFAAYFIAYGLLLVFGLGLVPLVARLALVDRSILLPFVGAVAIIASHVTQGTAFGVWLTLGVGVAGYLLSRLGFPLVPMLLGLILGPILETNLRRALLISKGNPMIFLSRPISLVLLILAAGLAFYFYRRGREPAGAADGQATKEGDHAGSEAFMVGRK